jgi:choline kinase
VWSKLGFDPQTIKIHKVSGSLTNAVFFVSSPLPRTPTLLLRIYGSSSGSLISRPQELHVLHVLSSRYNIGPKLYGTFENGRVEEYFDSSTLTEYDLRDKKISRWIGARMAEFHSVDLETVEQPTKGGKGWEAGVIKNVKSWLRPARDVLVLPYVSEAIRRAVDLDRFECDWGKYMQWVSENQDVEGASKLVFCHNDTQYGNLLRLNNSPSGVSGHQQVSCLLEFTFHGLFIPLQS